MAATFYSLQGPAPVHSAVPSISHAKGHCNAECCSSTTYTHAPCDALLAIYMQEGYLNEERCVVSERLKHIGMPLMPPEKLEDFFTLLKLFSRHNATKILGIGSTVKYLNGVAGYLTALHLLEPQISALPDSVQAFITRPPKNINLQVHYPAQQLKRAVDELENKSNRPSYSPSTGVVIIPFECVDSQQQTRAVQWVATSRMPDCKFFPIGTLAVNLDSRTICAQSGKQEEAWQHVFDVVGEQITYSDLESKQFHAWPYFAAHLIWGAIAPGSHSAQNLFHKFLTDISSKGIEKGSEILSKMISRCFNWEFSAISALLFLFQSQAILQLAHADICAKLFKNLCSTAAYPKDASNQCTLFFQQIFRIVNLPLSDFQTASTYLRLAPLWHLLFSATNECNPNQPVVHLRPHENEPTWRIRFGGATEQPVAILQQCRLDTLNEELDSLERLLENKPELNASLEALFWALLPASKVQPDPTLFLQHFVHFKIDPHVFWDAADRLSASKHSALKLIAGSMQLSIYLFSQKSSDLQRFKDNFLSLLNSGQKNNRAAELVKLLRSLLDPYTSIFQQLQDSKREDWMERWIEVLSNSPQRQDIELSYTLLSQQEQQNALLHKCCKNYLQHCPEILVRALKQYHVNFKQKILVGFLLAFNKQPEAFLQCVKPSLLELIDIAQQKKKCALATDLHQLEQWKQSLLGSPSTDTVQISGPMSNSPLSAQASSSDLSKQEKEPSKRLSKKERQALKNAKKRANEVAIPPPTVQMQKTIIRDSTPLPSTLPQEPSKITAPLLPALPPLAIKTPAPSPFHYLKGFLKENEMEKLEGVFERKEEEGCLRTIEALFSNNRHNRSVTLSPEIERTFLSDLSARLGAFSSCNTYLQFLQKFKRKFPNQRVHCITLGKKKLSATLRESTLNMRFALYVESKKSFTEFLTIEEWEQELETLIKICFYSLQAEFDTDSGMNLLKFLPLNPRWGLLFSRISSKLTREQSEQLYDHFLHEVSQWELIAQEPQLVLEIWSELLYTLERSHSTYPILLENKSLKVQKQLMSTIKGEHFPRCSSMFILFPKFWTLLLISDKKPSESSIKRVEEIFSSLSIWKQIEGAKQYYDQIVEKHLRYLLQTHLPSTSSVLTRTLQRHHLCLSNSVFYELIQASLNFVPNSEQISLEILYRVILERATTKDLEKHLHLVDLLKLVASLEKTLSMQTLFLFQEIFTVALEGLPELPETVSPKFITQLYLVLLKWRAILLEINVPPQTLHAPLTGIKLSEHPIIKRISAETQADLFALSAYWLVQHTQSKAVDLAKVCFCFDLLKDSFAFLNSKCLEKLQEECIFSLAELLSRGLEIADERFFNYYRACVQTIASVSAQETLRSSILKLLLLQHKKEGAIAALDDWIGSCLKEFETLPLELFKDYVYDDAFIIAPFFEGHYKRVHDFLHTYTGNLPSDTCIEDMRLVFNTPSIHDNLEEHLISVVDSWIATSLTQRNPQLGHVLARIILPNPNSVTILRPILKKRVIQTIAKINLKLADAQVENVEKANLRLNAFELIMRTKYEFFSPEEYPEIDPHINQYLAIPS